MNTNIYGVGAYQGPPNFQTARNLYRGLLNYTTPIPTGKILRPSVSVPVAYALNVQGQGFYLPSPQPLGGTPPAAASWVDIPIIDGQECLLGIVFSSSTAALQRYKYQLFLNQQLVMEADTSLDTQSTSATASAVSGILTNEIFRLRFDLIRALNFDTTNPIRMMFNIATGDARIISASS